MVVLRAGGASYWVVNTLNDSLSIPGNATAAYVGFNLHAHVIGKASVTAFYGR
jgi:hypothetical protein